MKKILIVDDNKKERDALSLWLKYENFEIIQAQNGLEGLEQAKINLPDLIISDITMPNLDGFGFYEELAKDNNLKNIPFILHTGTNFPEDIERAFELNIFVLSKPCDLSKMTEIIKNKIDNYSLN